MNSTETALIVVLNSILTELDKRDHAVLLPLLDMSAAFDTVDHTILLKSLESTFGITGDAHLMPSRSEAQCQIW